MVICALPYGKPLLHPILGLALRGDVRRLAHSGIDSLPQITLAFSCIEGIMVDPRPSVCLLCLVWDGPREMVG